MGVVVAEAVLLVVLSFFAVGLLHSYAGLLRRVQRLEHDPLSPAPARQRLPSPSHATARRAVDVVGESLNGEPIALAVAGVSHQTLLAFLSSGCTTCARFWAELPRLGAFPRGGRTRLVVVTKDPAEESPAALVPLASPDVVDTVMSSRCWRDYQVPGSPYFVCVDGPSGVVRGEGTALGWDEVFNLMMLADSDSVLAPGGAGYQRKPASDAAREAAVDRELLRAGIVPGDPSLYPTRAGYDHRDGE